VVEQPRGWHQYDWASRWHHYHGVEADCGRSVLPGVPSGGYAVRPLGPGMVCKRCLKLWLTPGLYDRLKAGA